MASDPAPRVPDVGALDEMADMEVPDPRAELAKTDHDTELGLRMAEDAKRVSQGELTSEAFWARYDEAAAEEFGDDYRETPNPAVDRMDDGQTIHEAAAGELSCAVQDLDEIDPAAKTDVARGEENVRMGMVIDLQNCVGCDSCTVACKAENRTPPGVSYNVVIEEEHGEFPETSRTNLPRPCMQCENPPCVQVCPVSATYKMEDGVVNVDYDRCIGCRYCSVACPYGARYFDFGEDYDDEVMGAGEVTSPEYGVDRGERGEKSSPVGNIRKCNFCFHRTERGEEPACVETCIGDARNFGNLADPESEVSRMVNSERAVQLKSEEGTDPNVYYLR
ncbi:MAG: Fe-S-cluster-containing dehydrogenase component [Natronomonas sp.]|jgi:Fe-S-cluster-containing dehydrogenase component